MKITIHIRTVKQACLVLNDTRTLWPNLEGDLAFLFGCFVGGDHDYWCFGQEFLEGILKLELHFTKIVTFEISEYSLDI